jgi:hypothetical protein
MASEQTAVTAATSPAFPPNLSEAATPSTTTIIPSDTEAARSKSLKRNRGDQSQNLSSLANAGLGQSPKSPKYKGSFTATFPPLTGAATMADERRKREEAAETTAVTENPGHKVLASLIAGGGAGMSKPQDAPFSTTSMSEGMNRAATAIMVPSPRPEAQMDTSPASVTSLASLGSIAKTATVGASPTIVASPIPMAGLSDSEGRDARQVTSNLLSAPEEQHHSNRAVSFPGNALAQPDPSRLPPRGLSLPMPGQDQQLAPRSPSQKRHKCPYCETEFTRHHNLKSHLLTHSQEKPYVCSTCPLRFRRLHDLKRHMKLHTGERPHICPKCDRKFARGDALARHSKGQGGCAGRRASMGSFGGDEDYDGSNAGDDDGMDGVMYTNGTPIGNEAEMTEEERRRFSLPSIKAQHVSSNQGSADSYTSHSRGPSTYPPVGPRQVQPSGGLYPPNTDRTSSSTSGGSQSLQSHAAGGHSPGGSMSMAVTTAGGSMYSQSGMTESPKPLSPAGIQQHQLGHDPSINRQRSPSLTTQFQQQHFGRRPSGRASPTGMSLPSPLAMSPGPKLPSLPGLAPPDPRYTVLSQNPVQNGGSQAPSAGNSPSTAFPPPRSGPQPPQQGGPDNNNVFADGNRGVWAYCQTLEERVKVLQDEVTTLRHEKKQAQDQILGQQDQLNRLSEENSFLRNQVQASQKQNQIQQPSVSTSS